MNNCYTSTDGSSSTKTLLSLLGIVLFVSVLYSTGITIDSVWQAMIQTQPIYIFFMVITTVGIVGLTSIKWQIILRSLNICIYPAAGYYFYYCAIGLLSNSVIPQVVQRTDRHQFAIGLSRAGFRSYHTDNHYWPIIFIFL
ncbi:MAG: hypothetical protein HW380_2264 [Magnetococcales bacterium]|nr:hypothetical protein [Magnetococcales bacterium]